MKNEDLNYILKDASIDRLMIMLIGHPLVGKSTFIKENDLEDFDIISRDELVLDVAGTKDYTEAWKIVDQGKVNIKLKERINFLKGFSDNVIIDMTNMTSKGRKNHLKKFKDFHKVAVVFPFLDKDELEKRQIKRVKEVNKFIPYEVIDRMKKSFEVPTKDEGFDDIIEL